MTDNTFGFRLVCFHLYLKTDANRFVFCYKWKIIEWGLQQDVYFLLAVSGLYKLQLVYNTG